MEKKTETAACQRHRPMMENISKTDTGKTHFIIKLMNNEWKQTVAAIAELCQLQADQCICVQPCYTMQFDFLIMGSGVIFHLNRMGKNKSAIVFGTHFSRFVLYICRRKRRRGRWQCAMHLNCRRKRLPDYSHTLQLPQTFTTIRMEKWDIILIEAKITATTVQLKEIIVSANLMDYRNKNKLHSINSELTFRINGRASADFVWLGYNSVES